MLRNRKISVDLPRGGLTQFFLVFFSNPSQCLSILPKSIEKGLNGLRWLARFDRGACSRYVI